MINIKNRYSQTVRENYWANVCDKCNALEKNVKEALSELGMTDEIDHVTDFGQIAAMGVMSTPALVIDNKVVSMGKVLSKDDVIKALKKVRG